MTSEPNLKEFFTAYLVEMEEYLGVASAQLLALEGSVRLGEANPRAVRETFRALHTMKGLSSMVGVEVVVTLAHRLEAFLRECDKRGMKPSADSVDTLLRGVRAIDRCIAELGRGSDASPAPEDLLKELDSLEHSPEVPVSTPRALMLDANLLQKLASFELERLVDAESRGQRALRADFVPSPERAAAGLSITSVRERAGKVAEIVKVLPISVPVTPDAPGGLAFALLLVTADSDDAIAAAVGIEPASVVPLATTRSGLSAPSADSSAPEEDAATDFMAPRRGSLRVDVTRLDDVMERLSALIVTRFRLARAVSSLTESGANTREVAEILAHNARQLRDLRGAVVSVRMVPVSDLLERVPLLVRGLRRQANRRVRLELQGGAAELDKTVSERLFPAIVHLVRNAVDHAIETPDERVRRGKPEEGLLRIVCVSRANNQLDVSVEDDGRGIDAAAVARKAGRAVPANNAELLEVLCIAGFSTRQVASTTSGRGMGMEIVKRVVVDELGGELELTTSWGQGTKFTLRVPLTVSIVEAFTFECRSQRFVVPISAVDEVLELEPGEIVYGPRVTDGGPSVGVIARRGKPIPVVMLRELFNWGSGEPSRKAIVIKRSGMALAIGVDRMLGQQEVVVRPIDDPLIRVPGVTGATDLGDGRPTLVLDLAAIGGMLGALRKTPEEVAL